MVNALELWGKIAALSEPAVNFYKEHGISKDKVLCQGAANFDMRVTEDVKKEESHYRIAHYASGDKNGYMDMHIKQNLAVFKERLQDIRENEKSILFVDYGCGPMTSGIALAEVLSQPRGVTDYKKRVTYRGVDISKNVVEYVRRINRKFNVFFPDSFSVEHVDDFCLSNVRASSSQIAVLCLSFVLAPDTFRTEQQVTGQKVAEKLAKQWDSFVQGLSGCEETRIIYINPIQRGKDPNVPTCWPHQNWHFFRAVLRELSNHGRDMIYSDGRVSPCEWERNNPCGMAMIEGKRRR